MSRLFPSEPEARRRRDRALLWFFLLASLVLIERAGRKHHGVLLVNQGFGERFLAHQDPYFDPVAGERVHGPYPPSYALVCAPLSRIPTPIARRLWCAAQLGALVILYRILRRRTRVHWPDLAPHALVLFGLALLLTSRFLLRDMKAGGGNLLYGTLAMVGLELSLAGREGLAGLPFALGLVLKPNLAPLLLFFALRRRWRTVLTTSSVAALLFFLPALYFGAEAYLDLAGRWARDVLHFATLTDLHRSDLVPAGLPPARFAMNQSLREAIHRLLRPPGDSGAFDVHLVETSARTAILVAQGIGLGLLIALGRAARRARSGLEEWFSALAFLPLCLLLSPITWKAHHALLVPLFFVLLALALGRERTFRRLLPVLGVYYLVCDMTGTDLVGERAGDFLQAISIVTLTDIVLVLLCVRLLGVLRRQDSTSVAERGPSHGMGEPSLDRGP